MLTIRITEGEVRKSISIIPSIVDAHRLVAFAAAVFQKKPLLVRTSYYGVTFGTIPFNPNADQRGGPSTPGRRVKTFGSKSLSIHQELLANFLCLEFYKDAPSTPTTSSPIRFPADAPLSFSMSVLPTWTKQTTLSAGDTGMKTILLSTSISDLIFIVPVFDLRAWISGKSAGSNLDLEAIIPKAPIYKDEVPEDSLVAVIHAMNYYTGPRDNKTWAGFNVYAVLILVVPPL